MVHGSCELMMDANESLRVEGRGLISGVLTRIEGSSLEIALVMLHSSTDSLFAIHHVPQIPVQ